MKILTTQHICSPLYHIWNFVTWWNTKHKTLHEGQSVSEFSWVLNSVHKVRSHQARKCQGYVRTIIINNINTVKHKWCLWCLKQASFAIVKNDTLLHCWRILQTQVQTHKFDTVQYTTQRRYIAKYRRSLSYAQWWQPAMNAL